MNYNKIATHLDLDWESCPRVYRIFDHKFINFLGPATRKMKHWRGEMKSFFQKSYLPLTFAKDNAESIPRIKYIANSTDNIRTK